MRKAKRKGKNKNIFGEAEKKKKGKKNESEVKEVMEEVKQNIDKRRGSRSKGGEKWAGKESMGWAE